MTVQETLKRIGLANGEIKVYLALLHTGRSSLSIIHEKTAIERRNIYDIINKLVDKGLVTYAAEQGKKTFHVAHPAKLVAYVKEQEDNLESIKLSIQKELPAMLVIYNEKKSKIDAEIYRGKDGFKTIAEEMLLQDEVWIIGGNGGIQSYLPHYWTFYNKRRVKKKVMWHDLIKHGTLMETFKDSKEHYYEFRVLPPEFQNPSVICIYGDKVANMIWDESLFAVVIQSKTIAKSYVDYFRLLWKSAKKENQGNKISKQKWKIYSNDA